MITNDRRVGALLNGALAYSGVTDMRIPKDWPVQRLKPGQQAKDKATCGTCGRSWDDGKVTGITPAPAARCPFEPFHKRTKGGV